MAQSSVQSKHHHPLPKTDLLRIKAIQHGDDIVRVSELDNEPQRDALHPHDVLVALMKVIQAKAESRSPRDRGRSHPENAVRWITFYRTKPQMDPIRVVLNQLHQARVFPKTCHQMWSLVMNHSGPRVHAERGSRIGTSRACRHTQRHY